MNPGAEARHGFLLAGNEDVNGSQGWGASPGAGFEQRQEPWPSTRIDTGTGFPRGCSS